MTEKNPTPQRRKLDLGGIEATPVKANPESRTAATDLATEAGFTTRHTKNPQAENTPPQVARRGRKKTTGRTAQFTVKLKPETNNAIYEIADELEVNAIAEVIEMAMEALEEKLQKTSR